MKQKKQEKKRWRNGAEQMAKKSNKNQVVAVCLLSRFIFLNEPSDLVSGKQLNIKKIRTKNCC